MKIRVDYSTAKSGSQVVDVPDGVADPKDYAIDMVADSRAYAAWRLQNADVDWTASVEASDAE